jgi:3-oxoacyl-[acyl-carrier protein] reductase
MTTPKIALVTGAAGVLGKAIAKGLVEEGMKVVLADIAQKPLEAVSQELQGETYPIAFDISDPKQVDAAMEKVTKEFGEIDVLVNNAGILSNNKAEATTPEEWQRVMQVSTSMERFIFPAPSCPR